jgi:sialic acid synthase SpsE
MTEATDPVFARLADPSRCFLIAEIGSNHDGDFDTALRLMDVAREAGADAVKFQSFLADELVTPDSPDHGLLKRLEVPRQWYPRLKEAAAERGLIFFSTATNSVTLGWMREIGAELYKIASPNLTHLPLIRETAAIGRPVVMSTGMADMDEIDEAVRAFTGAGNEALCLLHCVSQYPAPPEAINLRVLRSLQARYPYPVGYSDHTMDIVTPVAAVALGAAAIEKHLTLDRGQAGPDHHYALEPEDFIEMCRHVRLVERALGDGVKRVSEVERTSAEKYRRSVHAGRDLPAGSVLSEGDLRIVRPNDGLHPRHLDELVGRALSRPLSAGDPVTWADVGEGRRG